MTSPDFFIFVAIGFFAQLIDGALGMAYGVSATSMLMSVGVSPAVASATVHIAECVTTGASALSHRYFGNIDGRLFRGLLLPGVLGAICGAYLISNFPSEGMRPFVSAYLVLVGVLILIKAFRLFTPTVVSSRLAALGFTGGFLDAAGGGGWGPIVASTLIARGNELRFAVGSVNAVEFFVAFAASATFIVEMGTIPWEPVIALGIGGLLAAPLGAYACRRIPHKPFMVVVGLLVICLGVHSILRTV